MAPRFRRQRVLTVGFLCGVLGSAAVEAQIPELPGWDLVWNDEFDGAAVDAGQWEVLTRRDSYNEEKQYYLSAQISIHSGHARITATDEPFDGKLYRSGRMWTCDSWSYGRFEARADLPTTQGMWPAFWLLPRGADWPTGGEIDIMENRGSEPFLVSSAYHWGARVADHEGIGDTYSANNGVDPVNYHSGFHKYAAEWEPGTIRFYVDDVLHFAVTDVTAPIHQTPMSVVLNLAVGGVFGGDPDETTVFPQHFDIDYVRVWQRPDPPAIELINAGFDAWGGTLDAWNPFNNSANNVRLDAAISQSGSHSLKLSGRFNGTSNWSGAFQRVPIHGGEKIRITAESLVDSLDSLEGTSNHANMKLEFYSIFGASIDSPDFLGHRAVQIADGNSLEDIWEYHELIAIAPPDAVEARLTFVFLQPANEPGAVHIDSALLREILKADFDLDGDVDGDDFLTWQRGFGTATGASHRNGDADGDGDVDGGDFLVWQSTFSGHNDIDQATAAPEPSAVLLLFVTYATLIGIRLRT